MPSPFNPWEDPVPIVQQDGWALGLVLTGAVDLTPSRFKAQTVLCVASHYADCAVAVHKSQVTLLVVEIISCFWRGCSIKCFNFVCRSIIRVLYSSTAEKAWTVITESWLSARWSTFSLWLHCFYVFLNETFPGCFIGSCQNQFIISVTSKGARFLSWLIHCGMLCVTVPISVVDFVVVFWYT